MADVVLVTIDTLRADTLGFAGHDGVETPVLDRLAAGGTVFTAAHAHAVTTLPSHASILTGTNPYTHGIRDNSGFVLPEDLPTAAALFRDAGFATGAFVGAFPLDRRYGLDRGFDVYDDRYPESSAASELKIPERRGDEVVGAALDWWRSREGTRRFLWVHLYDPHAPYAPPEPFATRYADDPYLGEVAATDSFLAPLLEPFLDDPESAPFVAVTSDHGEGLGDHGELTHGLFAYEPTLRVPLILWRPGMEPGRSDRPARHVDLLPTLLEAAGLPVPSGLPGRSLLLPPEDGEPIDTYFEAMNANLTRGWAPLTGVIQDGRKLISLPLPELYDLGKDPGELHNLVDEQRAEARRLARRIPEEASRPPVPHDSVDPDQRQSLEALGYLSGSARRKETYTAEDDPKTLVELDQKTHRFLDLFHRGRLEDATALARQIVEARPSMAIGHYHLAQVLLERGRLAEAIAVMERAVDLGAASDSLLRQLALTLAQTGRPADGAELLAPLAATGDPEVLTVYGLVLSDAGRQAEAKEALERVFAADPTNAHARALLALVALREERWSDAETEASRAVELDPSRADALNYLGVARYNLGQPRASIEAWRDALTLDPANLDLAYNLFRVAAEVGNREVARDALVHFIDNASPETHASDIERARALLAQLESEG